MHENIAIVSVSTNEIFRAAIGYQPIVTKAAIEWALAQNLKLVPICPFTDAYLRRHPEYQR